MNTGYTKEELKKAVNASYSIANALKLLGLAPKGGNYRIIKRKLKEFEIEISHLKGKGWSKGTKNIARIKPIEQLLKSNTTCSSYKLKKKLIEAKLKIHKCECCNNTLWLNNLISLELHHRNGDHSDNRLENLQLLCPNCHSYTDNYRGKNKKKLSASVEKQRVERVKFSEHFLERDVNAEPSIRNNEGAETLQRESKGAFRCLSCRDLVLNKRAAKKKFCSHNCMYKWNARNIPTKEQLEQSFKDKHSFLQVGKYYHVSDNTIRKWCDKLNVTKIKTKSRPQT